MVYRERGTIADWAFARKEPMMLGENPPRVRRVLRLPPAKVDLITGRMAASVVRRSAPAFV
jgi:hypothetical protein